MSLDVTAYEVATLLPEHEEPDNFTDEDDYQLAFAAPGLERSLAGLIPRRYYTTSGRSYEFRAGSYIYYDEFRRALCRAALDTDLETIWNDPDTWADKPFFELLNFADNEGSIGPVAAAALAEDFTTLDEEVTLLFTDLDHQRSYQEWKSALRLAADTGMVVFS